MKKTIALASALLALALPLSAMAFSLEEYETSTQVAHLYVTGGLDDRMVELGRNAQTGVFNAVIGSTQKKGVERYCSFYARFGISKLIGACNRTITAIDEDGTVTNF